MSSPVLTAPVSAVPALFATVQARPGTFRSVKTATSAAGCGFDETERAAARSDGRKQVRNGSDGCGEDRASRYHRVGSSVSTRTNPKSRTDVKNDSEPRPRTNTPDT